MSFTYSFTSDPLLSQVRLLCADTDSTHPIFSDEEINAAIDMQSSSPYRAAALLLEALAANKARLAAINKLLDVQLSADKSAQELRATAKEYWTIDQQDSSFAIAEMVNNNFSARERLWKSLLRLETA